MISLFTYVSNSSLQLSVPYYQHVVLGGKKERLFLFINSVMKIKDENPQKEWVDFTDCGKIRGIAY